MYLNVQSQVYFAVNFVDELAGNEFCFQKQEA